MFFLIKGLLIGMTLTVPIGPVGLLCLRRSLSCGKHAGLISGLGAACADTFFAFLAILLIAEKLEWFHTFASPLQFFTALVLLAWGLRSCLHPVTTLQSTPNLGKMVRYFSSTLLFTLSNPMTLMTFFGAYASFGLSRESLSWLEVVTLCLGVFAGSMSWWVLLNRGIEWFKTHLTQSLLQKFYLSTGLALMLAGMGLLGSLFFSSLSFSMESLFR